MPTPDDGPLWIFGYGSIMWRPDFPYREKRPGFLADRARRFWQGSTDHRGVAGAPGRVVTVVPEPGAVCWGIVFRVDAGQRDGVLAALDHRESGGFVRESVRVRFGGATGSDGAVRALVYVAPEGNPNYLGPAPLAEVAEQVRRSRGPSGTNLEYVLELAGALRALGLEDEHVFELEHLLAAPGSGPR